MSTEATESPEAPETTESAEPAATAEDTSNVVASTPEFTSVSDMRSGNGPAASIDRFKDVRVDVWAELGRVQIPIGELLQIGEGSVIDLDRAVGDPVDLVSQGVLLARGEIVVVEDKFAIRIKEIQPAKE
jgi:flagellar motor switch protein FliN/FliY